MDYRDQDYIINMDETPMYFSMAHSKTLAVAGSRTVNGRQTKNATKLVTVAVTVTASGKSLKPMVIYEGKPSGRIVWEFPSYNPGGVYCCQERAWQNQQTMEFWIRTVLKPYLSTAPVGKIPVLLLDEYRVHISQPITNMIQDLGCEVIVIPGGMTCHTQPVDVGVNKPLKVRVKHMWDDFLMEQDINSSSFQPPSRSKLADWIVTATEQLPTEIVRNAWHHKPFSYFPWEATGDNNDANEDQGTFFI